MEWSVQCEPEWLLHSCNDSQLRETSQQKQNQTQGDEEGCSSSMLRIDNKNSNGNVLGTKRKGGREPPGMVASSFTSSPRSRTRSPPKLIRRVLSVKNTIHFSPRLSAPFAFGGKKQKQQHSSTTPTSTTTSTSTSNQSSPVPKTARKRMTGIQSPSYHHDDDDDDDDDYSSSEGQKQQQHQGERRFLAFSSPVRSRFFRRVGDVESAESMGLSPRSAVSAPPILPPPPLLPPQSPAQQRHDLELSPAKKSPRRLMLTRRQNYSPDVASKLSSPLHPRPEINQDGFDIPLSCGNGKRDNVKKVHLWSKQSHSDFDPPILSPVEHSCSSKPTTNDSGGDAEGVNILSPVESSLTRRVLEARDSLNDSRCSKLSAPCLESEASDTDGHLLTSTLATTPAATAGGLLRTSIRSIPSGWATSTVEAVRASVRSISSVWATSTITTVGSLRSSIRSISSGLATSKGGSLHASMRSISSGLADDGMRPHSPHKTAKDTGENEDDHTNEGDNDGEQEQEEKVIVMPSALSPESRLARRVLKAKDSLHYSPESKQCSPFYLDPEASKSWELDTDDEDATAPRGAKSLPAISLVDEESPKRSSAQHPDSNNDEVNILSPYMSPGSRLLRRVLRARHSMQSSSSSSSGPQYKSPSPPPPPPSQATVVDPDGTAGAITTATAPVGCLHNRLGPLSVPESDDDDGLTFSPSVANRKYQGSQPYSSSDEDECGRQELDACVHDDDDDDEEEICYFESDDDSYASLSFASSCDSLEQVSISDSDEMEVVAPTNHAKKPQDGNYDRSRGRHSRRGGIDDDDDDMISRSSSEESETFASTSLQKQQASESTLPERVLRGHDSLASCTSDMDELASGAAAALAAARGGGDEADQKQDGSWYITTSKNISRGQLLSPRNGPWRLETVKEASLRSLATEMGDGNNTAAITQRRVGVTTRAEVTAAAAITALAPLLEQTDRQPPKPCTSDECVFDEHGNNESRDGDGSLCFYPFIQDELRLSVRSDMNSIVSDITEQSDTMAYAGCDDHQHQEQQEEGDDESGEEGRVKSSRVGSWNITRHPIPQRRKTRRGGKRIRSPAVIASPEGNFGFSAVDGGRKSEIVPPERNLGVEAKPSVGDNHDGDKYSEEVDIMEKFDRIDETYYQGHVVGGRNDAAAVGTNWLLHPGKSSRLLLQRATKGAMKSVSRWCSKER